RLCSATSCFSRRFSSSSWRRRLASDTSMPSNLLRHRWNVVAVTPIRRQSSAMLTPDSTSLIKPMICSSVNLLLRISGAPSAVFGRSTHVLRGSTFGGQVISGSIAPGGYYLVQLHEGAQGGASLPTPDAVGGVNLHATTGKVALVSG